MIPMGGDPSLEAAHEGLSSALRMLEAATANLREAGRTKLVHRAETAASIAEGVKADVLRAYATSVSDAVIADATGQVRDRDVVPLHRDREGT